MGFPGGSVEKNLPANSGDARDVGSIPGWEWSPGEGNGNPLQYVCLENSMDRRAWWATVQGIAKSQTRLSTHTQYSNNIDVMCDSLRLGQKRKGSFYFVHFNTPVPLNKKSNNLEAAILWGSKATRIGRCSSWWPQLNSQLITTISCQPCECYHLGHPTKSRPQMTATR